MAVRDQLHVLPESLEGPKKLCPRLACSPLCTLCAFVILPPYKPIWAQQMAEQQLQAQQP